MVEAPAGSATSAAQLAKTSLATLDDVAAVAEPTSNKADDTALLTLVPDSGPSSEQTKNPEQSIRDRAGTLGGAGATVLVTGTTAVGIDVSAKLGARSSPISLLLLDWRSCC